MKRWFLIILVLSIVVSLFASFKLGYNAAIKDAVPYATDNGYIIEFDGNAHLYN